jgi:hypothetical protein
MIKDIVTRKAPGLTLSISCEVLPEIKEYAPWPCGTSPWARTGSISSDRI